jgi:iron complex transport system ATP-binding protein
MTKMLNAKNLKVGWEQNAVALLSELTVAPGEVVVLAGPNGAGKSTAVKTLARQVMPISGSVTIDGADLLTMSQRDFARQIAYVPQIIEPPKSMLVRDMVMLGRFAHQSWWSWEASPEDRGAAEAAMNATEIMELRDRPVSLLSGGERQRVTIAMALAQQTPFMLLDEPTAHLDFKHQMQLLALVAKLKEEGLGLLLVLHDLNLISRVADRVVLLEKPADAPSTIAASGAAHEVLTEEILRRVYEVSVAINRDAATGMTTYTPLQS